MKFYFCENCGKRITEIDIAQGAGKDKKLKGVYCKDCAVGVMTMEFSSITIEQARQIVQKSTTGGQSDPDPVTIKKRGRRKSSALNLPAAASAGVGAAHEARKAAQAVSGGAHSNIPIVVGSVIGGVVLAVLLLTALSSDPNTPTVKKDKGPSTNPKVISKIHPPSKNFTDDKSLILAPPPTTQNTKPPPETVTELVPEQKAQATLPFTPQPDLPPKTANEPTLPASPLTQPQAAAANPTPPPNEAQQAQQRALDEAKTKFAGYFVAFDAAAHKGDLAKAAKVCEDAKADPELQPLTKEVKALTTMAEALARADAAKKKALQALLDGKKRSFTTKKGTVKGVVRKVEGDVLKVRAEFRINNKVKYRYQDVKLSELSPEARARLLGEPKPATPDEWVARAIRKLAEKELEAAEKALAAAGDHPLAVHYRHRIDEIRLGAREAAAKRLWQEQISPFLAVKKLSKQRAKAGQKILAAFHAAHGKTKFAASVAKQAKVLEVAMQAALGPPRGVTLDLGEGVKMKFALIPAGTFMMGDPEKERGRFHERSKPQHKVTLTKAFYLGKYEVTQAQYERIMGVNPSRSNKGAEFPVEQVKWNDCQAFCKKLSEKTGTKARLPTEAEWEHACRAGTETRFYFGDADADLDGFGWSRKNSGGKTHPIGRKKPNGLGLFDMHGNVWEWCQDRYGAYTDKAVSDPKGPASGNVRVFRGGGWFSPLGNCRSAFRGTFLSGRRYSPGGFRVLLDF